MSHHSISMNKYENFILINKPINKQGGSVYRLEGGI